jgi:hypothetical protein
MTTMNSVSMTHPAGARSGRRPSSRLFAFNATCVALLLLLAARTSDAQQRGAQSSAAGVLDASSQVRGSERQSDDFGYALAVIGDVNGDRVTDFAASDVIHRQIAVFSGASGDLLYVVDAPEDGDKAALRGRFAAVDDVNGDSVPDLAVEPSTRGPVALFSGADGTFLFTRERVDSKADPARFEVRDTDRSPDQGPDATAELGRVAGDLVIADVNADGISDLAVAGPSSGEILIYSGANGSLLRNLQLPWVQKETASLTTALRTCVDRIRYVQAGDWRTLETFWNTSATGYFYFPAGAQIKVRYGVGWFGYDSDKQTLDGLSTKVLRVGGASVLRARMQMKFGRSLYVNYTICQ